MNTKGEKGQIRTIMTPEFNFGQLWRYRYYFKTKIVKNRIMSDKPTSLPLVCSLGL